MNWSFCICSNPTSEYELNNLHKVIVSIRNLQIPIYEILLCGPFDETYNDGILRVIGFDENIKKGWITRKKNLMAQETKYENLCILHDYISFDENWYAGWERFGENWEVACNIILNPNGSRHSDFLVNPFIYWQSFPDRYWKDWNVSLPYETIGLTKIRYLSGNYWCCKQKFILKNLLNEDLVINEAEDIEWSNRIKEKTEFAFNINSINYILKDGKWSPQLINANDLEIIKKNNGIK